MRPTVCQMLAGVDKDQFIAVLLCVIYLLNGPWWANTVHLQTMLLKMRQPRCSEAVMWMAARFQLLSTTYNRAVAQEPHNQDALRDEKYTKWPSAISSTRWPRQGVQGPPNLGKITFRQLAQDELGRVLTNPLTRPNAFSAAERRPDVGSFAVTSCLSQLALHSKQCLLLTRWHKAGKAMSRREDGWRASLKMEKKTTKLSIASKPEITKSTRPSRAAEARGNSSHTR